MLAAREGRGLQGGRPADQVGSSEVSVRRLIDEVNRAGYRNAGARIGVELCRQNRLVAANCRGRQRSGCGERAGDAVARCQTVEADGVRLHGATHHRAVFEWLHAEPPSHGTLRLAAQDKSPNPQSVAALHRPHANERTS